MWLLLGAAESDGRKSGGTARQTCRQGFVCVDSGIGVMELQVAADATMESLVLAILRLFSPCRDDMELPESQAWMRWIRRYSPGVVLRSCLNIFVRWLWSQNPVLSAISVMSKSVSLRRRHAALSLCWRMYCPGRMPIIFMNMRWKWDTDIPLSFARLFTERCCSRFTEIFSIIASNFSCHTGPVCSGTPL